MMLRVIFIILLSAGGLTATADEREWVNATLNEMSLDEKIGQLFMIAAYSNRGSEHEREIGEFVRKYAIGGVIFFQGDPVNQVRFTNQLQETAKYPLLIGLDAEHGAGWRLQSAMVFPQMLTVGAVSNDSAAFRLGAAIARHCRELGVHVNFAPSADINNNPANPVIGMRSFGENREHVYRKARMYIDGSLSENVLAVAKHFPGHGDTGTDSHEDLPLINHPAGHIDSVELYPFHQLIRTHLPAIMVAHLNVRALDTVKRPATLSPVIINGVLRGKMSFGGLCFTDAMNMRGVTKMATPGEAELKALLAGNDIILFPADVESAVKTIRKAVAEKVIAETVINEKCRKVLAAKYKYALPNSKPLRTDSLWSRLNRPEDFTLKQAIYRDAITVIKNDDQLLPLKHIDTLSIASIHFGADKTSPFQTMLSKYAKVDHFALRDQPEEVQRFISGMEAYNCIIIYNSAVSNRIAKKFGFTKNLENLIGKLSGKRVILCHPSIPYGMDNYLRPSIDAAIISYEDHLYAAQYAAQAIFGGIPAKGHLPVSVNDDYPQGYGLPTPKVRLGYESPEMCGIHAGKLSGIDSLCLYAIETGSTPGCQVLVAKDNYILYNKAFGHHTYEKKRANHTSDIYDIASVTKVAATLPVIMKLYDEQKIALDKPVADYYPPLKHTNKKGITLREILSHHAGLKKFISFFPTFVDTERLPGGLFANRPTKNHTLRLMKWLYANPNYQFKRHTVSYTPADGYQAVAPGLYLHHSVKDSILSQVFLSEISDKKEYIYSDLGFILLKEAIECITKESFDRYCQKNFYRKLGAYSTGFVAAERLNKNSIVPSNIDNLFRKSELRGYVHDPSAFLLGGITGNAGLFSTAEDLAKIMAMFLNDGKYGGEDFFTDSTIRLFAHSTNIYQDNRRGLGFDKPEFDTTKISPVCKEASAASFGHTGFTGTIAWSDPEHNLIYIFLSNRTYPDENNTKLIDENIRTKIQAVIYDAIRLEQESFSIY